MFYLLIQFKKHCMIFIMKKQHHHSMNLLNPKASQ